MLSEQRALTNPLCVRKTALQLHCAPNQQSAGLCSALLHKVGVPEMGACGGRGRWSGGLCGCSQSQRGHSAGCAQSSSRTSPCPPPQAAEIALFTPAGAVNPLLTQHEGAQKGSEGLRRAASHCTAQALASCAHGLLLVSNEWTQPAGAQRCWLCDVAVQRRYLLGTFQGHVLLHRAWEFLLISFSSTEQIVW